MNDAGDVTENCEEDVDEEVCIAATLQEDTQRWKDDGKNDLADITVVPESVPSRAESPEQ